MPQVEFCVRCRKEINPKAEKYVVLQTAQRGTPRMIAHVECANQPATGPRIRYVTVSKGI
jgi:hypothetical protein